MPGRADAHKIVIWCGDFYGWRTADYNFTTAIAALNAETITVYALNCKVANDGIDYITYNYDERPPVYKPQCRQYAAPRAVWCLVRGVWRLVLAGSRPGYCQRHPEQLIGSAVQNRYEVRVLRLLAGGQRIMRGEIVDALSPDLDVPIAFRGCFQHASSVVCDKTGKRASTLRL